MPYALLLLAILAEVFATSLLKMTEGFSRLWPTVLCLGGYAVSVALLAQAVKHVPVGVAYAMWSGLGTLSIVAIGVSFLDEGLGPVKALGVVLVVAGVTLLNLGGVH